MQKDYAEIAITPLEGLKSPGNANIKYTMPEAIATIAI